MCTSSFCPVIVSIKVNHNIHWCTATYSFRFWHWIMNTKTNHKYDKSVNILMFFQFQFLSIFVCSFNSSKCQYSYVRHPAFFQSRKLEEYRRKYKASLKCFIKSLERIKKYNLANKFVLLLFSNLSNNSLTILCSETS